MTIQHRNIPDAELHEIKGASTATVNEVASSNGDGTTTFRKQNVLGWYDYNHSDGPLALTLANTFYDLPNNGLGAQTSTAFALPDVPNIWNTSTNRFDFTGLDVGDTLDMRFSLTVTNASVDTYLDVVLEFGVGSGFEFTIPIISERNFRIASTRDITISLNSYVGNAIYSDFPARIKARADKTGVSVTVIGWFTKVNKPGEFV